MTMHEGFDDGPYGGSPADAAADAVAPKRTFVMKQPRKDELRRQLEVKDAEKAVLAEKCRAYFQFAVYAYAAAMFLLVALIVVLLP